MSVGDVHVSTPAFMQEIVATFSHVARQSSQVNQRSGVSVRLSVSNLEVLGASALRRALRSGETVVVPRVSDMDALAASTSGKIEIESLEEGRDGLIIENMVKQAVLTVFKGRVTPAEYKDVILAFEDGLIFQTGEDVTSVEEASLVEKVPAIRATVLGLTDGDESPAAIASAVEFLVEGLHLSKRLNKDASGGRAQYRARS